MDKVNDRYVLHDNGVWMYYLGDDHRLRYLADSVVPQADGAPMTALRERGWWATDHEATTITVRIPGAPRTTGFRLLDQAMASERFPVELTVDEWHGRYALDEEDALPQFYREVTEPDHDEVITLTGPWTRLDGTPPPADDRRTWVASLPNTLLHRTEYQHLFPGRLTGFRDHIAALAKAHPYSDHVFNNDPGGRYLKATFQVPFDQPVTEWRPPRNRDGSVSKAKDRKGQTVTALARRELVLEVPDHIGGADRAEAAAEWDRLTGHYQQLLDEVGVTACSACHGNGYLTGDSDGAAGTAR